jgi:Flp pilus assembly protein protease CpaA
MLTKLNGLFSGEDGNGKIYFAPTITLAALASALIFAFSQTVWLQAVRAEVYSLQLILTLAVFFLTLSLYETETPTKFFLLSALFWGLSLTVHPLLSVSVLAGFLIIGCFSKNSFFSSSELIVK